MIEELKIDVPEGLVKSQIPKDHMLIADNLGVRESELDAISECSEQAFERSV